MAVSIKNVAVTKDYATWQDVKDSLNNWDNNNGCNYTVTNG